MRGNIGWLLADGSVDSQSSAESQVHAGVQTDGKILVGAKWLGGAGPLTRSVRNYIGRINPDGSVDPAPTSANNWVNAGNQGDGAVVIGSTSTILPN